MKQKQKGNVAVVALIIVIVAITASVITWMVAKKTQAPVQQEAVAQPTVPVAQTQPITQPIAPTDETANWQTYSNVKYGYEFKYPQEWVLNNFEKGNIVELSAEKSEAVPGDAPLSEVSFNYYPSLQELTKQYQSKATSLDDFITISRDAVFSDMKKINFVGISAWAGTEASISGSYVIYVEKNSHIYKIEFGLIGSEKELTAVDREILSTFKFTR